MRAGGIKASALAVWKKAKMGGLAVALALAFGTPAALAETKTHHVPMHHALGHHVYAARHHGEFAARHVNLHHYANVNHHSRYAYANHYSRTRLARYNSHRRGLRYASAHYSYSRLQCVPYAREVSHIQLSGDAFLWWAEASGRYARGNAPVEGAVLNFRSIRRMPLGHVAVVTSVIDSRTILVTQANWIRGTITNDVTMQDVSPENDWSQVQVELGDSSRWGAAYPTYGFIYNQPANSTVIASAGQGDEVAEAPRPVAIQADAPDRNLQ